MTALDHDASLEEVQSATEYADPSTTKRSARRENHPEKPACFVGMLQC
jgi:hypothetical protein